MIHPVSRAERSVTYDNDAAAWLKEVSYPGSLGTVDLTYDTEPPSPLRGSRPLTGADYPGSAGNVYRFRKSHHRHTASVFVDDPRDLPTTSRRGGRLSLADAGRCPWRVRVARGVRSGLARFRASWAGSPTRPLADQRPGDEGAEQTRYEQDSRAER